MDPVLVLGTVSVCGLGGLLVLFRTLKALERSTETLARQNRDLLEAVVALRSVEAAQHLSRARSEEEPATLSPDGPDGEPELFRL